MVLACLVTLMLIFILPAFGITGSLPILLLLVGCFVMHLFMMHGHDDDDGGGHGHH
jgi:hypothetical protein